MGWSSIFEGHLKNKKADGVKDFLINEFEGDKLKVVDYSKKGNTVYMAIEIIETKEVFAAVVLTSFEKGEFFWKTMDETEGPAVRECPQRILKRLSPLAEDNKTYAAEWRKECWEFHENRKAQNKKPYEHGDVVEFPQDITFGNGDVLTKFIVIKQGKKTIFAPYRDQQNMKGVYGVYRISKWKEYEPKVIAKLT